jgi:hypothetical protein
MNKIELKKANGDLFFEAERKQDNTYILVNWIGIQSLETIMMGAHQLLTLLCQQPCPAILYSNKELIGPWDDGALFLGSKWAQEAKKLGLKFLAEVQSPGIYGQRSLQKFNDLAQHQLQIETFTAEAEAEAWLLS